MTKIDKTRLFLQNAIDKMFEIAEIDLNYERLVQEDEPEWFNKYTWTEKQQEEWIEWLEKEIKKRKLVTTRKLAKKEAQMINLNYGLKIKQE